ncbi:MAG: porin [Pseudomonadales bacterium]
MFERYLSSKLAVSFSCGILFCGALMSTGASAQQLEDLRWHGFLSQGVIHTDENNFFGDSTDTSFDFRDVGLGLSWKPQSDLLFSAQLIYRDAGLTSPNGVNLDFAMVNYSFINRLDFGMGVRAGRVKNPYAFYNETRDIAATRPSVLLPQSIYPEASREFFHSSDSVVLYGYKSIGDWVVNVDVLAGKAKIDNRSERLLIPSKQDASLKDDNLFGVRSIFEFDGGRLRIGFTYIEFDAQIDTVPVLAPPAGILPGGLDLNSRILSFEYNWERLQLTSEYLRLKVTYDGVFGPGVRITREREGYYFQLGYRLNEQWRIFGRYDVSYPDRKDKSGDSQLLIGAPRSDGFSKDITVGTQYNFSDNWLLAAEVHHIKGTANVAVIENPNRNNLKEDWNLYTFQLSYKF